MYHRSYEIREPIEVRILPDHVTITSYPGPDRSIKPSDLQSGIFISRRYRNRRIGEFLKEYREGFLLFHDDIWNTINLRNDRYHYQQGLFIWDIPAFNETVIREAILNAISHREYLLSGSVFVRQFPTRMEIVSPGGFPPGITPENILLRQSPRNRHACCFSSRFL